MRGVQAYKQLPLGSSSSIKNTFSSFASVAGGGSVPSNDKWDPEGEYWGKLLGYMPRNAGSVGI